MLQTWLSDGHVKFSVVYHIIEKYEFVHMLSLDIDMMLHFSFTFASQKVF